MPFSDTDGNASGNFSEIASMGDAIDSKINNIAVDSIVKDGWHKIKSNNQVRKICHGGEKYSQFAEGTTQKMNR